MNPPFHIQLHHPRFPFPIKITLIVLMAICFLAPIFGFFYTIGMREGISFGHFLGLGAGSFIAYRLLRIYLWNAYGTEHLWLEDESLNYQPDFRYFKGNTEQLAIEAMAITVLDESEPKEPLGRLRFQNREKTFETVLKVPLEEAHRAQKQIEEALDQYFT